MSKRVSAREVADLLTAKGYEATYDETSKSISVSSQQLSIGPANEADELDYDLISYGFSIELEDEDEEDNIHMARIYDEEESGDFTAPNLVKDIIEYMEGN